jgi:hypothetical protein
MALKKARVKPIVLATDVEMKTISFPFDII